MAQRSSSTPDASSDMGYALPGISNILKRTSVQEFLRSAAFLEKQKQVCAPRGGASSSMPNEPIAGDGGFLGTPSHDAMIRRG